MTALHIISFAALWLGYQGYWSVKSRSVKASTAKEPLPSRLVRLVVMLVAIGLLVLLDIPLGLLDDRFLPTGEGTFWAGFVIAAVGLGFSVWGRRHLGGYWSQAVTLKEDHRLITSGPYAFVRHPIYSGLLLGLLGSAIAIGEIRGLAAVALVFSVLWQKLRLEERWMRERFGTSYENYAAKVAALVPYIL